MKYVKLFNTEDEIKSHLKNVDYKVLGYIKDSKRPNISLPSSMLITYYVADDEINTAINVLSDSFVNEGGFNSLKYMVIDNTLRVNPSRTYTFTKGGGHTVKFVFDENANTSLQGCFRNCVNVMIADLKYLKTYNVTDFSHMFRACESMRYVYNAENLDTSKATTLNNMFRYCLDLRTVDMTNWDVSNVTDFGEMFLWSSALTNIGDLTNWNVSKATTFASFLGQAYGDELKSLTSIGDLTNWDTSNVTSFYRFIGWNNVLGNSGDFSHWDTSNATSLREFFVENYLMTSISPEPLNKLHWNTSKVTDMRDTFSNMRGLEDGLDITELDTSKVTTFYGTFRGLGYTNDCIFNGSGLNTTSLTNLYTTFCDCTNLTECHVEGWDTSKVTNFGVCFRGLNKCTTLDLSSWSTAACSNIDNMFSSCNGIQNLILGNQFFTTSASAVNLSGVPNWSHDSLMTSLYTNQLTRDTSNVKTITLNATAKALLSESEIAQIATVGLNIA